MPVYHMKNRGAKLFFDPDAPTSHLAGVSCHDDGTVIAELRFQPSSDQSIEPQNFVLSDENGRKLTVTNLAKPERPSAYAQSAASLPKHVKAALEKLNP